MNSYTNDYINNLPSCFESRGDLMEVYYSPGAAKNNDQRRVILKLLLTDLEYIKNNYDTSNPASARGVQIMINDIKHLEKDIYEEDFYKTLNEALNEDL